MEESQQEVEPLNDWAVIGLNFGSLIIYMWLLFSMNVSDMIVTFILFCHFALCLCFALYGKRSGWWVSATIVAYPLFSSLFYTPH
jgi:hypothetical protein